MLPRRTPLLLLLATFIGFGILLGASLFQPSFLFCNNNERSSTSSGLVVAAGVSSPPRGVGARAIDKDDETHHDAADDGKQPTTTEGGGGVDHSDDDSASTHHHGGARRNEAAESHDAAVVGERRRRVVAAAPVPLADDNQAPPARCFSAKGIYKDVVAAWFNGEESVCYEPTPSGVKADIEGMAPHTHLSPLVAKYVIKSTRKSGYYVELGSFRGGSAALFTKAARELSLQIGDFVLHCMDPFTGDVAMNINRDFQPWLGKGQQHQQQHSRSGAGGLAGRVPTLVHLFNANIRALGIEKFVLPHQVTSLVGLRALRMLLATRRLKKQPDAIYVDSAHERNETFLEISEAYSLLPEGGMLFGDDYSRDWLAVVDDVNRFASTLPCGRDRRLEGENADKLTRRRDHDDRGAAAAAGKNSRRGQHSPHHHSQQHPQQQHDVSEECRGLQDWPVHSDIILPPVTSTSCPPAPLHLHSVLKITGECQWIMRKIGTS